MVLRCAVSLVRCRGRVDRLLLVGGPDLYLNLARTTCFRYGNVDIQHTVMEPAVNLFQIEAVRQRDSSLELAVCELSPGVAVPAFRATTFAFEDELVVVQGDLEIVLRYAGDDRPEVEDVVGPRTLDHG